MGNWVVTILCLCFPYRCQTMRKIMCDILYLQKCLTQQVRSSTTGMLGVQVDDKSWI